MGPSPARHRRWLLGLGVAAVLGLRVYHLLLTRDQPVWWDEAEYLLKARAIALGTPDTGFWPGRPMALSLAMAGFFAVGLGETSIRVALMLLSVATVILTYRIGRRVAGPAAGAIGGALFSVFYVPVFYTSRVMTEIPHLALCLLGIDLFLSGHARAVMLSGPVLALATLTRFPAALMLLVLALHDLVATRGRTLGSRPFLVGLALGGVVALPYLAWSQLTYGDALRPLKASRYIMPTLDWSERVRGVRFHLAWFARSVGWPLVVLASAGVALGLLRHGPLGSEEAGVPARGALLALWIIVPLAYFGLLVRPLEDRYLITALPPVFVAIGAALVWGAGHVARRRRRLAGGLALAAGGAAVLTLLADADRIVRSKLTSYAGLRDAGHWLRTNSSPGASVMTSSGAQITYYSERATIPFGDQLEAAVVALGAPGDRYLLVSAYEQHPPWVSELPHRLVLREVATFPPGGREVAIFQSHGIDHP